MHASQGAMTIAVKPVLYQNISPSQPVPQAISNTTHSSNHLTWQLEPVASDFLLV